MGEYLSPGVYREEFDAGPKAMEGIGTSTAGFVGMACRGPVGGPPRLITGFADYRRWFGEYVSADDFGPYRWLPYSVEQFFSNGGSACYVVRVVPPDARCAQFGVGTPLHIQARNPGKWGNRVTVTMVPRPLSQARIVSVEGGSRCLLHDMTGFEAGDIVLLHYEDRSCCRRLTGVYGQTLLLSEELPGDLPPERVEVCGLDVTVQMDELTERYPHVSVNPQSSAYLSRALKNSELISLTWESSDETAMPLELLGAATGEEKLSVMLADGSDGTVSEVSPMTFIGGGQGDGTGLTAFRNVANVGILAVPGITLPEVQSALVALCEEKRSCFAVLDIPQSNQKIDEILMFREWIDSSYAAMYHPWLQFYDAQLKRNEYFPPSGAMAGIYARTDQTRGVHKAPANETVNGCTGLSIMFNEGEQAMLNPHGINLIRSLPGMGIRVWGARTCSSDGNWKYINIRRLMICLRESIQANLTWAASEPNDPVLWGRMADMIKGFLTNQWRCGALVGGSPDEAFFVNVGLGSTMTADDIADGRLICVIGAAPIRPAEFIIFRIEQRMETAG